MEAPANSTASWVIAAVARAEGTAERWLDALDAAGLDAEIRLEDAQRAAPGSSPVPGYLPASPPFAFALYVPREQVAEARRVLIDHGWDGRYGERRPASGVDQRTALVGALLAVGAAVVVIAIRALSP